MNNRGICIIRIVEFFVDETMKSWWISKDTTCRNGANLKRAPHEEEMANSDRRDIIQVAPHSSQYLVVA